MHVMEVPQGEKRGKEPNSIQRNNGRNFQNLMKNIKQNMWLRQ